LWLSFVVGPVLLLLGFQLRLLLLLWPKMSRSGGRQAKPVRNWRAFCRVGVAVLICVLLGGFSAFVATVPGERVNQARLRDWDRLLSSQNLFLGGERLVEQDEDKTFLRISWTKPGAQIPSCRPA
jgi:hypothetical protein